MKNKKNNSRKTLPENRVTEYFKKREELMNFGSREAEGPFFIDSFIKQKSGILGSEFESKPSVKAPNYKRISNKLKLHEISRKKKIKVLNYISYIGIIIGCFYQCGSFLSIYLLFPTIVELNVANEAVLDFPAVTVCNSNPVKYKIWCKEDTVLCKRKFNETIEDYRERQGAQYDKLGKKRRIDLGDRLEELVVLAEYEEKPVMDSFQIYYDYEFTNCFTFNAAWGDSKDIKSAIVFNPVTGKSSELILCVNMDADNYSNISGKIVPRAKMSIHANDIVPNPSFDAASLESGSFYSYGVQKVTTKLLKSPYQTKCRNYEEEREYRTGARMSQKNCLLECYKTEMENLCACTYRRLALMYDAVPCETKEQFECLENVDDVVFKTCNPLCPMACTKTEFQFVATDSEPLRQDSDLYKKGNISHIFTTQEQMNENMACIGIHYGSTETRTLTHHPKYPFIELFSLLGGYSGLWLGFSLLNGYEFLLVRLIRYFQKKKESKQKMNTVRKKRRTHY